ncbi:hypothetical protein DXG01_013590, partial [Tephrocybe rancida]
APILPSSVASTSAIATYINSLPLEPPPSKRCRTAATRLRDPDFLLNDPDLVDTLPVALAPIANIDDEVATQQPNNIPGSPSNDLIFIDTPANAFGVFRRFIRSYNSLHTGEGGLNIIQHDPEAAKDISAMSDIPKKLPTTQIYSPFPNKNSFLLSQWYWNGGPQKSKDGFRKLIQIIGSEDFIPGEVARTAWDHIDHQLGVNDWDREEWQVEDAGWMESFIHIKVPFHRFLSGSGVQDYKIPGFFHCSLTAVIHEKLTTKREDAAHFILEPYELLWLPDGHQEPIPLHGE